MRNIVKSICVIIGTIIGAGFASGKEIYIFFNQYGRAGIIGILLASGLTGIIIYCILMQVRKAEVKNYHNYLEQMKIKPKVKEVLNCIVNIFLLMSFYVMITGFCAYFNQELNIPVTLVAIGVSILCYITFINHIEGVTKINTILIPFLIIMIIAIGVKSNCLETIEINTNNIQPRGNWILASLEYASYNSILLIPILIGLKRYSYNNEKRVSLIITGILLSLTITLYLTLQKGGEELANIELPLIYIVKKYGTIYKYIYGLVIASAIYTSAIAAGYGFAQNCSKSKKSYKTICVIICITAIPVSNVGFSYLVNALYPMFGLLGLIQILVVLFRKRI